MKTVILAGGYGTRISEESLYKPKPLVEIGGMPILWHIMKHYSSYGFNDFIICAGYKQELIKKWFDDYYMHAAESVTFDYRNREKNLIFTGKEDPWKVTVVNTGLNTQTGGRIKKIGSYIGNEPFMVTYGDGVGNVDIDSLIKFHKENNTIGTISLYSYAQEKGVANIDKNGSITSFREKSDCDTKMINIGFMVFEPEFLSYIENYSDVLEKDPFSKLVSENQINGYIHRGFWQCMDTVKEKNKLEELWKTGKAPWKTW